MSYGSDDLTPLLGQQPTAGVSYRQGIIRAWDPTTAANTVEVAGALIDDLPILNTNEALLLQPGDVVGILASGASWAILGRLTVPGTAAASSALSAIDTITGEQLTQHSTNSTSWVTLTGGPTVTVNVRPSGRVLLLFSAQIGWANPAPGAVNGDAGIAISGANSRPLTGTTPTDLRIRAHLEIGGATTSTGIFGVGSQKMLTGLNPGDTTFTMRFKSSFGQTIDFDNRVITAILL